MLVVIITLILIISMNDLAVLLQGEIRCWSFQGFKGLRNFNMLPFSNNNLQAQLKYQTQEKSREQHTIVVFWLAVFWLFDKEILNNFFGTVLLLMIMLLFSIQCNEIQFIVAKIYKLLFLKTSHSIMQFQSFHLSIRDGF